ncbi:MAG: glycoside hydrolase family 15 protein, partial [Pseudomonadota bacterium]
MTAPADLNLGLIGNGSFGALVDRGGRIVWCCLPRFDGDPVFHSLLGSPDGTDTGFFDIAVQNQVSSEQAYDENTAILRTRLTDAQGQVLEIVDFAPRFDARERTFRPLMMVRRLRPIHGAPRITVRLRPRFEWGDKAPTLTHGSNHIRYVGSSHIMRLTTNAPVDYILNETPFLLEEPMSLLLGPDETPTGGPEETAREFEERTAAYWRDWTKRLALPLEWQEATIRAAITLKLCVFEKTGAIIAAMTTSIPEAPHTQRNWDYRFCWVRDAFFVIRALNSLSAVSTMEHYLRWLNNIVSAADGGHIQPVFGVAQERNLAERLVTTLPGYRGMGPVRAGNQAHEHYQYDVYGNVVLGASQAFFDKRLTRRPGPSDFARLEQVG